MENQTPRSSEHRWIIAWVWRQHDAELQLILNEIACFQEDLKQVKADAARIVATNQNLYRNLRYHVERRLSSDDRHANGETIDLQSQLSSAIRAKDETLKMYRAAVGEIERLQQQLGAKEGAIDADTFERCVSELRADYARALEDMTADLEKTRNELNRAQGQLCNASAQAFVRNRSTECTESRLEENQKALDGALEKLQATQERLLTLEESRITTAAKLARMKSDVNALTEKCATQSKQLEDSFSKNKLLEQRLDEALEHAEASIRAAEQAILEKEEAVVRGAQMEQETAELRTFLACLVDEAANRTKDEVEKVQAKSGDCIRDLLSQVKNLQAALDEKMSGFQRISEENGRLQVEIARLADDYAALKRNRDPTYRELSRSLREADGTCEEYRLLAESLQSELVEQQNRHAVEVKCKGNEIQQLQAALLEADRKAEAVLSSQIELECRSSEARRRAQILETEVATLKGQLQTQTKTYDEMLKRHEAEASGKLEDTREAFERRVLELQALLEAQRALNENWQAETSKLTSDFETELGRLRAKVSSLKTSNDELRRKLAEATREAAKERKRADFYKQQRLDRHSRRSADVPSCHGSAPA